jgi:hypothetical protein
MSGKGAEPTALTAKRLNVGEDRHRREGRHGGVSSPFGCSGGEELEEKERRKKKE